MGGLAKFFARTREPLVKERLLPLLDIFRRFMSSPFGGVIPPIIQIRLVVSVFTDTASSRWQFSELDPLLAVPANCLGPELAPGPRAARSQGRVLPFAALPALLGCPTY